jgi:hypothetical protein
MIGDQEHANPQDTSDPDQTGLVDKNSRFAAKTTAYGNGILTIRLLSYLHEYDPNSNLSSSIAILPDL